MAGHSKWANIQHRKGRQDAVRAKLFSKLSKEITVAAKMGDPDPDKNPRLRLVVKEAKSNSMPKENIERAIKKAIGGEGDAYEEIRYEGYGPNGVAVIVEAMTDNRNRTASEVRAAFSKFGGSLGETGSVSFMFDKVGQIIFTGSVADAEAMFEAALEAGADNVESDEESHVITCAPEDFNAVREALQETFGDPEEAELTWIAQNTLSVDEDQATTLLKFIDALEDNDDVQSLSFNFEISDEIMAKIEA